ncbi:hypothetical protein CEXT_751881 [Caerostris extrusa]|uniref:Uncharacterized protein n=1 Tax=Caerostris extrusa TaxID=172846 RepID=A0AAV4TGR0_CAEEX|nr:hypothetical protein CEXT_751881 [Caerostris extrusa]
MHVELFKTKLEEGKQKHPTSSSPQKRAFRFGPKLEKFKPVITCSSIIDNNLIEFISEGLATLQLRSDKQRGGIGITVLADTRYYCFEVRKLCERESQFVR